MDAADFRVPFSYGAVSARQLRLAIVLLAFVYFWPVVSHTLISLAKHIALVEPRGLDGTPRRRPLPHVSFVIPWIGHTLQLRRRGAQYLQQLIVSTPADIFTIDVLSGRVLIANPSVEKALARHVHEISLARVISLIGRRSLDMSDAAVRTISEYDPRPGHARLFASADGSAQLAASGARFIREQALRQPREQKVAIGRWLFGLVAGASAHALWGARNPWNEDEEFMRQFV